jgi:hypothetical protein
MVDPQEVNGRNLAFARLIFVDETQGEKTWQ